MTKEEPLRGSTKSSPRILVVEDDALVALETSQILAGAGFEVVGPAKSVAKALELIQHTGCDAAILDISLGSETSERVARELNACSTPFVTQSAYTEEQYPPLFKGVPALVKPLRPEPLLASIRRAIRMHRMMARLNADAAALIRVRNGCAYAGARSSCLLCRASGECLRWLGESSDRSADFCPNLAFFNLGKTAAH
jgi:DNA-binding response OmpR family regulator